MINGEKYKKEILEICKSDGRIALSDGKICRCGCISCSKCDFNGEDNCMSRSIKWMLKEYKKPIQLSEFEYQFLKALEKNEDAHLARDEDGELYLFNAVVLCFGLACEKNVFQFIKPEQPYKIIDILNNCEVIEDE